MAVVQSDSFISLNDQIASDSEREGMHILNDLSSLTCHHLPNKFIFSLQKN